MMGASDKPSLLTMFRKVANVSDVGQSAEENAIKLLAVEQEY
jgi:hypothetical protein